MILPRVLRPYGKFVKEKTDYVRYHLSDIAEYRSKTVCCSSLLYIAGILPAGKEKDFCEAGRTDRFKGGEMKRKKTEKIAKLGLLTSAALIASYIELLVPVPVGVPGVKLGLANMVTVWSLYVLGPFEALTINALRILLSGFMFGSLSMILYSLAGAGLSFLCMCAAKRSGLFSVAGVSIIGGVTHNIGQLLVAVQVLETNTLLYYSPVLLAAGLITGALIGFITQETGRRLPGNMHFR